jgi:selenocysteine lyase/cysteine desulfurase
VREHFSRFFAAEPDRLHFAAHSHHPWPDVAYEAHKQYWLDSARLADDKWDYVFGEVIPETRKLIAATLGLNDPGSLTFAPNTHDFLVRIFSCLEPPVRILSSGSEFHSFTRQSLRWEEAGLAIVDRIDAEPFRSFSERISTHIAADSHDLIYLSSVFFDSGYVVGDLEQLVDMATNPRTYFVIDGYHQFLALPTDIGPIEDRVFFLAGGYKYAMAGEGVCFLHCPPDYGPRPVDTGWYAGFGELEEGVSGKVGYNADATRFAGATYDPSGIYRLRAVLVWLEATGITPADIHQRVTRLQEQFLSSSPNLGELVPESGLDRGNFLTFRSAQAGDMYRALHDRGVITDYRGDRLRIGFGIYHDQSDVDRLLDVVASLG